MDHNQSFLDGTLFDTNTPDFAVVGEYDNRSTRFGSERFVRGDENTVIDFWKNEDSQPEQYIFTDVTTDVFSKVTVEPSEAMLKKALAKTKSHVHAPSLKEGEYDLREFEDIRREYNTLSDDEFKIWAWYQTGKLFDKEVISNPSNGWSKYIITDDVVKANSVEWIKKGYLAFDGDRFIPASLFYSGNMYSKKKEVEDNWDSIQKVIGPELAEVQLSKIKKLIPEKLVLDAPKDERLFVSPLDMAFINQFRIQRLTDGTDFFEDKRLPEAFLYWINEIEREEFENGSNSFDVRNHYLTKSRYPNGTSTKEKAERDRKAQMDGMALFQRFLAELIMSEDQRKIEHVWNSTYNNWKDIDYSKVPFAMQVSKHFKNTSLEVRPAQREGVAFASAIGSGVIAYDVGVGKTMTAILGAGQAIYTGQCKRPVVIVPNPTYDKWIAEITGEFDKNGKIVKHGIIPQYPINSYKNLGVDFLPELQKNPPKDGTISIITYEALEKVGFGSEVQEEISGELFNILSQGGISARDQEQLREKIEAIMGDGTSGTEVNLEDLGWDYMIVDEAHNMKKIFTKVQGEVDSEGERQTKKYQIDSGTPSTRGLKTFMFSQLIQKRNNGNNVLLLTATPFTNSPLEVYSMLALVGYRGLVERGINNISTFFDKFVDESYELVVTHKGSLEVKPVIKGFRNKIVLQSIIYNYINYKSGEEANIKRPSKIVYPYFKGDDGVTLPADDQVDTTIPPSSVQTYWLSEISRFANKSESEIDDFVPRDENGDIAGRDLRAINYSRQLTLSPYLFFLSAKELPEISAENYVELSPKLKYTVECVRTVKEWHESRGESVSGQVIYMDLGTEYFPLIKEYLVSKVGYSTKEVEIISGKTSANKKENIKKGFLDGSVKIIIGSSTIKEGIDLQNRSTCLYNCALDWNPTDVKQLEGRIWRFGNQHAYVRIVNVLVENSLDVFMFQKLEEKTARINDIWFREGRGNVLNIDELDPSELKIGLITDPKEKAKQDIRMKVEKLEMELAVTEGYIEELSTGKRMISNFNETKDQIEKDFVDAQSWVQNQIENLERAYKSHKESYESDQPTWDKSKKTDVDKAERLYNRFLKYNVAESELTEKAKIQILKVYYNNSYRYSKVYDIDNYLKNKRGIERLEKNVLAKNKLTLDSDFEPLIETFKSNAQEITSQIADQKSEENFQARTYFYLTEAEEKNKSSKSIGARVIDFKKHSHLLSCMDKVHACDPNEPKVIKLKPEPTPEPKPEPSKEIDMKRKRAIAMAEAQKQRIRILQLKMAV